MKKLTVNTCGFDVAFHVFSSVEEYDRTFYEKGGDRNVQDPCLDSGNKNVLYRYTMPKVRTRVANRIEEQTDWVRKTKPVLNKDGTPKTTPETDDDGNPVKDAEGNPILVEVTDYDETENDFIKRVQVRTSDSDPEPLTREYLQGLFDTEASLIQPDPSGRTPAEAKPKTVSKKFIEVATQVIASGKAEAVAEFLKGQLGLSELDATDAKALAGAIAEHERKKNLVAALIGAVD